MPDQAPPHLPHLLVFGLGYSGLAIARAALQLGWRVTATSRTPGVAPPGIALIPTADAGPALATATHLVATAPPGDDGDPILALYGHAFSNLRWAGYLSTTGVYGDRAGAWVDETTAPAPTSPRAHRRLAAEQAWRAAIPASLDIFRLAGIYGPGRSPFADLRAGHARRIAKPGHLFGRIHRDDIAGAVLAAARRPGNRILNLSDDEPASSADVTAEAARLLGLPPPPAIPYAAATLSPMAQSFWSENRRVRSTLTQQWLARPWTYPTYREGLRATLAEELAEHPPQQR